MQQSQQPYSGQRRNRWDQTTAEQHDVRALAIQTIISRTNRTAAEMVRQLQILGMEAPQQQVELIHRYAHRMLQNNADQNLPYNVLREAYDRAFGAGVGLATPPRPEPLQPPPPQTSLHATGMMQEIMTNFHHNNPPNMTFPTQIFTPQQTPAHHTPGIPPQPNFQGVNESVYPQPQHQHPFHQNTITQSKLDPPKPLCFSGESTKTDTTHAQYVHEFVQHMQTYLSYFPSLTDAHAKNIIRGYLRDRALLHTNVWLSQYPRSTMQNMLDMLLEEFIHPNQVHIWREEICKFSLTPHADVENACHTFQKLLLNVQCLPEKLRVSMRAPSLKCLSRVCHRHALPTYIRLKRVVLTN